MQPSHVNLDGFLLLGFGKDALGSFQKLALPLRDLVGVHIELLG